MGNPTTVGAADLAQPKLYPKPLTLVSTRLHIEQAAIPGDLMNDAAGIERSAHSILELAALESSAGGILGADQPMAGEVLWGILHLLELAKGIREAAAGPAKVGDL